ncbi:tyrosine-type recombinase/integrase [Actinopolymorpha alba]|uniref:tyrosine-type recombinase/integrase n=1 Tax=Actinopolymorpha alba TaxID=533267 RepID=UPI0003A4DEEC|nr:tyrosine-type recombinase/integrase [Actinopolymorpha alba]
MTWYDFACKYVDLKWRDAAATYRRSIAEALTTATVAMLPPDIGKPFTDKAIRLALRSWAFNCGRRNVAPPPRTGQVLDWIARNTLPVADLEDLTTIRCVLDALASRLDGTAAAATVFNRKRMVLSNALDYAVELELLNENLVGKVKRNAPKARTTVDRRSVVNPSQARELLTAVTKIQRSGPRLTAFFAVMYFAALRPEEAVNLRKTNLSLPRAGWGELHLAEATPDAGKQWTDSGKARDERQLKHRAKGDTRTVPCPPELTALLHNHLENHGTDPQGRLFWGERGGELDSSTYGRVWAKARQLAFGADLASSSALARRPYDLRHAAVSTWLNGGVPATQVAEWAGHSVAVLLRVYAKCLDGQDDTARRRVEAALRQG